MNFHQRPNIATIGGKSIKYYVKQHDGKRIRYTYRGKGKNRVFYPVLAKIKCFLVNTCDILALLELPINMLI